MIKSTVLVHGNLRFQLCNVSTRRLTSLKKKNFGSASDTLTSCHRSRIAIHHLPYFRAQGLWIYYLASASVQRSHINNTKTLRRGLHTEYKSVSVV
jgi:hypothetical protein